MQRVVLLKALQLSQFPICSVNIDDIEITVLENGSSVLFDGKEILKFMTTDPSLRKEVVKVVRQYYSGSKT